MAEATAIVRLKEVDLTGESTIHLEAPSGDGRSLCGYAEEGSCSDGDTGLTETFRGKINCPDCIKIVRFGKTIPARMLSNG